MKLIEILFAVWMDIKENKTRIFLTSLGVIIGTCTIIMVVGIGIGSSNEISQQFSDLSSETILIRSKTFGREEIVSLNSEDLEVLKQIDSIQNLGISQSGSASLGNGEEINNVSLIGVDSQYFDINDMGIYMGEGFEEEQITNEEQAIILGASKAEELYGENLEEAIGSILVLGKEEYTIIGILEASSDLTGVGGYDQKIFMPFTTMDAKELTKGTMMISAQALSIDDVEEAISAIEEALIEVKGSIEGIAINDAGRQLEAAKQSQKTMSSLLTGVSIIVLLVGGIGIMNVLLVSVKERTKEIGILKSIGASKKDILLQFLIEAVGISLIGGSIGALFSYLIYPILMLTSLRYTPSIEGVLLGMAFALLTGTIFGFYPAKKAADMKPIDALNME
ncbi:ABC transporter permease [Vallitalea okinawensis]|uniref:ABC transporter permease n=1 Tax=Vallitalea okinawensis TaxID=2078660 RepID=UPI000CFA8F3E|nr:ABC transporter permease [Vallitalea okinawensis]